MNLLRVVIIWLLTATFSYGQFSTRNPLDEVRDQVAKVLADANLPFTPDQESQLALFIEEQRQASEDLFGVIMDFSDGPPQGEERDRALSGIQWMHDEFKKKLPDFLTSEQRAAWERSESAGTAIGARIEGSGVGGARREQIQQIRIQNNAFNVETATSGSRGPAGGGERTEVIQRGGAGVYHGNFAATFQDESLNARNPFAANKPPYYERTISGNVSGPLVRDRLTVSLTLNDNRQENVGTVKAEKLEGPFSLGITRPEVNRSYEGRGIFQVTDAQSLHFGFKYGTNDRKNEGIGDFVLPERGTNSLGHQYDFDLRQMSVLSERAVHETRFSWLKDYSETNPIIHGVAINVPGAFSGGGAQDLSQTNGRTYEFRNLLYYVTDKLTLRTGFTGTYRRTRQVIENNFTGSFTFSSLENYRRAISEGIADRDSIYRVTRGNPLVETSQFQAAVFVQNDVRLTNRFTLNLGARYQKQTNIHYKGSVDPRAAFAYAVGSSTVVRGGFGVFSEWLNVNTFQTLRRLDGTRQHEIQIDGPGFPDPFISGNVRIVPPSSRRVGAPNLLGQYYMTWAMTLEQSLPGNLFVSVGGDYNRGVRLDRTRNLNAPLPGTGVKPFPNEGHIYQSESTGTSVHKLFRMNLRQRFSIFNVNAGYILYLGYNDQGYGGPAGQFSSDSYNRKADWGRAGTVPEHQFNTSVNSRLPMDVYLTTVVVARSGMAYNITTGLDDNRDGVTNDRPPGVKRNSADGPGFFDISFNFSKAFQLGGSQVTNGAGGGRNAASGPQMNVFANVNNAFNMTHPGTPNGVMTSPFFRKPTSASAPREIEVGMRFQF